MSDENPNTETAIKRPDDVVGAMLLRYSIGARKLLTFDYIGNRGIMALASRELKPLPRIAVRFPNLKYTQDDQARMLSEFTTTFLESLVVLETTIFEVFIDDVTTYLIKANPGKHLKGISIDIGELLGDTRANIINARIANKARQMAFEELVKRLDFLGEKFGLEFALSPQEREVVKRWSQIRNDIVHSGSSWKIETLEPETPAGDHSAHICELERTYRLLVVKVHKALRKAFPCDAADLAKVEERVYAGIAASVEPLRP